MAPGTGRALHVGHPWLAGIHTWQSHHGSRSCAARTFAHTGGILCAGRIQFTGRKVGVVLSAATSGLARIWKCDRALRDGNFRHRGKSKQRKMKIITTLTTPKAVHEKMG